MSDAQYLSALSMSIAGLNVQKLRTDVAAMNIANMHNTSAPGQVGYTSLTVQTVGVGANFANMLDAAKVPTAQVVPSNAPVKWVYEPGHPLANEQGLVAYPGVNHLEQMVTLNEASRMYQANLVAFNATKGMMLKALEIGTRK